MVDKDKEPKVSKGGKVTQLDKEFNIDVLNLLIGGLLTQFYIDKAKYYKNN